MNIDDFDIDKVIEEGLQKFKLLQEQANQKKIAAEREVQSLIDKGEEIILGDSIITLGQHGGVHIRRARLLSLL